MEAEFTTYDGDRPDAYVLSVNLRRRSLTKGQAAMITVKARSVSEHGGRSDSEQSPRSETEQTARSLGEATGISLALIGRASTVLRHAPDLVDPVINGAMGLDEAYDVARENKAKANSAEVQLARLRDEDPQLADRVTEGDLSLQGAWAERRARVEEEKRQRRVATQLLCETLPSLAQVRGTRTFALYDPDLAPPGRAVTREVIEHAASALAEAAAVWVERDLP